MICVQINAISNAATSNRPSIEVTAAALFKSLIKATPKKQKLLLIIILIISKSAEKQKYKAKKAVKCKTCSSKMLRIAKTDQTRTV